MLAFALPSLAFLALAASPVEPPPPAPAETAAIGKPATAAHPVATPAGAQASPRVAGAVAEAPAEAACKSCWNPTCGELRDFGLPACTSPGATASTTVGTAAATDAAPPTPCKPGQTRNANTGGHCCWPGQAWSSAQGACSGGPACPSGFRAEGKGCTSTQHVAGGQQGGHAEEKGGLLGVHHGPDDVGSGGLLGDASGDGALGKGGALGSRGSGGLGGLGGFGARKGATDGGGSQTERQSRQAEHDARSSAVVAGEPTVSGGLDRAAVRQVVTRRRVSFLYCYERRLQANPALAGQVTLRFVVGRDGRVGAATVLHDDLVGTDVASCVAGVAQKLVFPEPVGTNDVLVTWPFRFVPRG
jgi:hypothetical protein